MASTHGECIHCESVDVTKGLCLRSGGLVQLDGASCSDFSQAPRCRFCASYQSGGEDGMGLCTGLSDRSHWVPGNLNAKTCEGYHGAGE